MSFDNSHISSFTDEAVAESEIWGPQIISEAIFPTHLLTGAKHPAFSPNHLADTDKTTHSYN